jgi:hypothetical protein
VEQSEYQKNLEILRRGEESKRFIPFYRTHLKPILQHGLLGVLKDTTDKDELSSISQYAKLIDDIEIIMKRIIVSGENSEKVLRDILKGGKVA